MLAGLGRTTSVCEAGLELEFFQRVARRDELHALHVGALPDQAGQPGRLVFTNIALQVDRKIERIIPAGADGLRVLDDQVERGRYRQRNGDHEHDHQARERLPEQSAERG